MTLKSGDRIEIRGPPGGEHAESDSGSQRGQHHGNDRPDRGRRIDGDYAASQAAPLVGTLAPAMNGGNFSADLALNVNIVLGCVGSGCSSLGFPISDIGLSLLSVSFLSVTDLAVSGNARITANFPIEVDGVLGTLDLIGVEVSRSFVVPEPGTFTLVAAGLLGLAAQRRPARRLCGRATSMCERS